MTQQTAIRIKDLHKGFGRNKVLQGLNLDVPEGCIYAYLGRNGEGKTTTMRLLLNILTPDEGSLEVLGMDPARNPVGIKLETGYVPEIPFFYNWMRVREVLNMMKEIYGSRWDGEKAMKLMNRLGLLGDSVLGELSMGFRAKVSLVTALSHNPRLLLLDDPTSGLDAVVRREFLETLVELVDESRCTVFFSSHIINDLERVADRVGLLCQGKLMMDSSLEELKAGMKRFSFILPEDAVAGEIREKLGSQVLRWHQQDRRIEGVLQSAGEDPEKARQSWGEMGLDLVNMDLEDIFVVLTGEEQKEAGI